MTPEQVKEYYKEESTRQMISPVLRAATSESTKSSPKGGIAQTITSPGILQAIIKGSIPTTKGTTASKTGVTKTTQPKSPVKTAEQKYKEDVQKQIENAYKQQVDYLTTQERTLQTQLPDFLKTISTPFEQQQPMLEQQLAEQQTKGLTEQEKLREFEQQALATARRGAEEQGLRAIQQFGGVGGSSAAQAAGELIGREALKQQGAIRTQTVQGIQNIQDQLRAIQSEFNANVSKLQLQKEQALSQARVNFQQQLDTIRKEKALAGVTKAQQTIQALQDFAARRRNIEDQVTQQANNLNLLREQAALNAQSISLQQSLTGKTPQPLPFKTSTFFEGGTSNQSNELAKVLQAGLAAGTLKSIGTTKEGIDLFVDPEGKVVDIRGNKYEQPLQ